MVDPNSRRSPLTDEEKSLLRSYSRLDVKDWIFQFTSMTIIVAVILFFISIFVWRWVEPPGLNASDRRLVFLGSAIVSVAFSLWCLRSLFHSRSRLGGLSASTERDLVNGIALVSTFDVIRAVEIEEFEDEGTGFLLELSNEKVLCVIGQDLYDFSQFIELDEGERDLRAQFPQTRIEYRCAPLSGVRLGVKGVGNPLRPFGLARAARKRGGEISYTGPSDGEFYDGPVERTLKKFDYTLEKYET